MKQDEKFVGGTTTQYTFGQIRFAILSPWLAGSEKLLRLKTILLFVCTFCCFVACFKPKQRQKQV